MSEEKPRGILRNKSVSGPESTSAIEIDRQEVIKNTRLNAELTHQASSEGDKIRAELAKKHLQDGNTEHLQWDELNLYKTEQEKSSTMKIDEPKTPYEGGFNPQGEYYQNDDEYGDDENNDIPEFELGEGEFDAERDKHEVLDSLHGGQVIRDPSYDDVEEEEEEEPELTAEERHKRFEEMRKAHYHMKGNVMHRKLEVDDEDDDDNENEKNDKDEVEIKDNKDEVVNR
ncbi:hypothetical protein G9P44_001719 [Scheffersomyces stipitis]|nr:hypothetical protein G9P44_001719 [Scheffersomyces stipitis]